MSPWTTPRSRSTSTATGPLRILLSRYAYDGGNFREGRDEGKPLYLDIVGSLTEPLRAWISGVGLSEDGMAWIAAHGPRDMQGFRFETASPRTSRGPASIRHTSRFVDRLFYSPEEAIEAKARIAAAPDLSSGTKAAYKAHVARRTRNSDDDSRSNGA